MVAEDLERRLSVRVVSGLVLKVLDSDFRKEGLHDSEQVSETDALVDDDAFYLMELSEMGRVQSLVPEYSVDREVLHGLELLLLGLLEEHLRADGGGVRPQDVLHGLLAAPAGAVADRAGKTFLVGLLHALLVLLRHTVAVDRVFAEEGVLEVTGWVTLRLEQRVEVPERRLDPAVRRHLIEAHGEQDFAELSPDFEEGVEVTALGSLASRVDVRLLEGGSLPGTRAEHLSRQLRLHLDALLLVVRAFRHLV